MEGAGDDSSQTQAADPVDSLMAAAREMPELVDKELLRKVTTLKFLQLSPTNYKRRLNAILDDAGYGNNESPPKKQKTERAQGSTHRRKLETPGQAEDPTESSNSEEEEQGVAAQAQERTVKRRLQKKASTQEKLATVLVTTLWADMGNDNIAEITVPFSFEDKDNNTVSQWSCNDQGVWTCTFCRSKTKGCTFDPEGKNVRLDNTKAHNLSREHRRVAKEKFPLPEGAIRWVPWFSGNPHPAPMFVPMPLLARSLAMRIGRCLPRRLVLEPLARLLYVGSFMGCVASCLCYFCTVNNSCMLIVLCSCMACAEGLFHRSSNGARLVWPLRRAAAAPGPGRRGGAQWGSAFGTIPGNSRGFQWNSRDFSGTG